MPDTDEVEYLSLVHGRRRAVAAQTFFELLVLKTKGFIQLNQEEPYSEIKIMKTVELCICKHSNFFKARFDENVPLETEVHS